MIRVLAMLALLAATGSSAADPTADGAGVIGNPPVADSPLGSFHYGEWRGRCNRDGFLAGARAERCVAELTSGSLTVSLSRSVVGVTIAANLARCGDAKYSSVGRDDLARRDRVT